MGLKFRHCTIVQKQGRIASATFVKVLKKNESIFHALLKVLKIRVLGRVKGYLILLTAI